VGRLRVAVVVALVGALVTLAPPASARQDGCVDSVPEPLSRIPVRICFSLFRPTGADAGHRVPIVIDSHGWSSTRTRDAGVYASLLGVGIGVLSFDQRGFGESGGSAHWQNPDVEGRDVSRMLDVVASLDWVMHESPSDPVVGALGASYGGGFQYAAAFTDHRFDALVPRITWYDANRSFAPSGVVRTYWAETVARDDDGALPGEIRTAILRAASSGIWPDDLHAWFARNGPRWHVQRGERLDIPVLLHQGMTDTLFDMNEAISVFDEALSPAARARSIVVGFNGGHVSPGVLPLGASGIEDPCGRELGGGPTYWSLVSRFFQETLQGVDTGLGGHGAYHLATAGDRCAHLTDVSPNQVRSIGRVVSGGSPTAVKIASGPARVAGVPSVDARVTTVGVEGRAFLALAVGTTPADARIVQGNMHPLREPAPVVGVSRSMTLPAVAVDVPRGQSLFLLVSPTWDSMVSSTTRTATVVLDDVHVHFRIA
jgi:pimeloyl-ACP methyl ester carboxylesterase